jgi:hypothetical protein
MKPELVAPIVAGKIFINCRRDDERVFAARVRDRLAGVFGNTNVFMDVDNLMAGQRFDKELEKALAETDIFIAVIGPQWMQLFTQRQAVGERDYVREEIVGALKSGIVVISALIERTALPRADDLPEDIRALVLHQKHDVTHEHFWRDIAGLIEAIRFARKAAQNPNMFIPLPGNARLRQQCLTPNSWFAPLVAFVATIQQIRREAGWHRLDTIHCRLGIFAALHIDGSASGRDACGALCNPRRRRPMRKLRPATMR